jgi:hypothetical protein
MKLTSTLWTCQRCGAGLISTPPEHGLCDQCIRDLEAFARANLPDGPTCIECGGPVCPDCGEAVAVVVPLPTPLFPAAYRGGPKEVNGDGGGG